MYQRNVHCATVTVHCTASVGDPDPYVFGLPDPNPELLNTNTDPDPYIIKQK